MDDPSSAWLKSAIQHALSAAADTSSFSSAAAPPLFRDDTISVNEDFDPGNNPAGRDPRFRKLVEAVLFSRVLLNTYNLVLLVVLLGLAAAQWGGVMRRAWRRRAAARRAGKENDNMHIARGRSGVAGAEESGASSSSSSTLEGTATPPDAPKAGASKVPDEQQPLLPRGDAKTSKKPGVLGVALHRVKAWLMYQPRPIPVVHKELPANGTTLLILAFLGLNVFYLFFRLEFTPENVFVFADRCGMLIALNLPLLYLFAAKNQPITWLTGYSYESLNILHRRLGELLCLLALLHGLGMFAVWYGLLRHLDFSLARFVFTRVVSFGLLAFVCYELLYLTSLRTFRALFYELFLALHVALQTLALVFLFIHHARSRLWVGIALLIFVVDRLVYRLAIKSTHLRADLTILPDGQTVRLSSNWSIPSSTWGQQLYRRTVLRGWNAPDHVFISIPALGSLHALQAHPFTIATPAPSKPRVSLHPHDNDDGRHAWLSLLVRARSGFSQALLRHAQTNSSTLVRLDGPYGSTRPLRLLQSSNLAVVVAGGSGVAVAFPLLWTLLNPAARPDLERQTRGLAPGCRGGPSKVCFLWVVRQPAHREWLPAQRLDELRGWGADVLVTEPTRDAGRPDVEGIVGRWVREHGGGGAATTGVVVSGPDAMNRDARNACSRLVGEGHAVRVNVEKFGW
ncbi:putative ferric reductase transmembrane component protein [Neofusicoccum parvum UCRNP2]|uniref:Putative ferric reductase transmembrane component protein n=1 Tax=Botryosphaeria parva (strain UCR-NP2) TaxID=1287680 RepID=R1GJU0_BOTPV|nr:putative ferric reductase transmembrane component protein [Neofusicoccum parvum UCRNP2]